MRRSLKREFYIGYTHYWTFKKKIGFASATETKYKKALIECQKIVLAWYKVNGGLSGYSAHTKLGKYGGLEVNGKGDDGHETFSMREHFNQNFESAFNPGFDFCKTARKPYDTVVVACLATLAYRLGASFEVSSDGDASEWDDGVKLASKVLRRKIPNPIKNREQKGA